MYEWDDTTLNRPCPTVPFDNSPQCSRPPCDKYSQNTCCPRTSRPNVHKLPVTSYPKTHVVRAQVAPIFMSSPHKKSTEHVTHAQVIPYTKQPKIGVLHVRDNLCAENMNRGLHVKQAPEHQVNLCTDNMFQDYLSQRAYLKEYGNF